jgi:hypothetical protein
MSKLALLLIIFLQLAPPALGARRMTVDQLAHLLAAEQSKSDSKIAQRLYGVQLSERLNPLRLSAFEAQLPGPESRRSLTALADQAEFLDLPANEIPAGAAPDLQTQRQIMAQAVNYATLTMHRLPNLFATRDTIRFEDSPAVQQYREGDVSGTFSPYRPLHPVGRSLATVEYRDGHEVIEHEAAQDGAPVIAGLTTSGEFGPILATVLGDLPKGKLQWSHWEEAPAGRVAVFRYALVKENSHYQVRFCCLKSGPFERFSSYHGEIAVDPRSGAVLRLTLIADLAKSDPIAKANIMVGYGPVELGQRTYICPLKSVSISVAPARVRQELRMPGQGTSSLNGGRIQLQPGDGEEAPPQLMLNHVVFDQYHLFRAEQRILNTQQ